ncbi:NEURL1 [Branchiostoma lanceolatum]|uniref:NEURL1 protein n=1 Tax=Branchiostoma lanceolatum TaxID=7740 RepID=A0A8K0EPM1_BRALA|nr:NEURL1 [Branchiostoma lanceolatum]
MPTEICLFCFFQGYQAITVTASPHGEIHAITLTPRGEGQGALVLRASTSQPGVMELCPAGSQVNGQPDGTRDSIFADILQHNHQPISTEENSAETTSLESTARTVNPALQNGEDRTDNRVSIRTVADQPGLLTTGSCLDNGQSAHTASLSFHPVHGSNVRLESDQKGLKSVAANVSQSMFNGLVFTYRPLQPGQILLIYILEADSSISNFDFGLTAANPAALQQKDVPSSRAAASRRKEYWTFKYLEKLRSGDKLTFLLDRNGRVHYGVNGGDLEVVLEVEAGQQLWAVFILTLFVRKIRLAGVVPAEEPSPAPTSPSTTPADRRPDTEPRQPYHDDQTCAICYERPVNSVAYPCGHVCMCDRCGLLLKVEDANCPICRAPLFDVIKMYRA